MVLPTVPTAAARTGFKSVVPTMTRSPSRPSPNICVRASGGVGVGVAGSVGVEVDAIVGVGVMFGFGTESPTETCGVGIIAMKLASGNELRATFEIRMC